MPRPAPWRLDPGAYPYHDTIQTRFADLDVLGHINNVAWAALFETARVRFLSTIATKGPGRQRGLVANVEINYLAEGHFPGDLTMAHGIGRIGGRSWQIVGLAMQGNIPAATCDVTIVTAGGEIDPAFRAELARTMVTAPSD